MSTALRWVGVAAVLREQPAGSLVRLPRARVEHPRDGEMRAAMGMPVGQRADYRLDVGCGQDLVVTEFVHFFEAHLEHRPVVSEFEAVLKDSPGTALVGLIAGGALVGLALGRSKDSALVGATIGGIAALAGVGVANAQTAPQVADVSMKVLAAMQRDVAQVAAGRQTRSSSRQRRGPLPRRS